MAKAAGSLPSASRWQRLQAICRLPADGKGCMLCCLPADGKEVCHLLSDGKELK